MSKIIINVKSKDGSSYAGGISLKYTPWAVRMVIGYVFPRYSFDRSLSYEAQTTGEGGLEITIVSGRSEITNRTTWAKKLETLVRYSVISHMEAERNRDGPDARQVLHQIGSHRTFDMREQLNLLERVALRFYRRASPEDDPDGAVIATRYGAQDRGAP